MFVSKRSMELVQDDISDGGTIFFESGHETSNVYIRARPEFRA
jgi:hypothetical protein